jgi:hypothetical protein
VAGRRVDPRISTPRGLSWSLVAPPGTPVPEAPNDVTVTKSADVSQLIAVRPDGIAADPALASEALGVDFSRTQYSAGPKAVPANENIG